MNEVISALDVINKNFKRSLRGYDPVEVDDFLDLVAESLHYYAEKSGEQERKINQLEKQLEDYRNLRDSLQEALLMAQQSADEKVEAAKREAEAIVAEARAKAERILEEASQSLREYKIEIERLKKLKVSFVVEFKSTLNKYAQMIEAEIQDEESLST
ncbi:MAG: DivIVA domain-containing protein [Acetomicrobium flavidum]|uniref:DivIVA domain-containing protein n=1 Tax=Acetomicrobium flavidum TaxID=49896 RepID=UPI00169BD771|nr:DivIVA domain-containing protein [Acetomicrobium flavidum]